MYPVLTGIPPIDGGLVALSCLRGKSVAQLTEEDFRQGTDILLEKARNPAFGQRYKLVFTQLSPLVRNAYRGGNESNAERQVRQFKEYMDSLLTLSRDGRENGSVCPACGLRSANASVIHHQFPLMASGESLNLQGGGEPQKLCWACAYVVHFLPLYLLPTGMPSFVLSDEGTMRIVWKWRETYAKKEESVESAVRLRLHEVLAELLAVFKSEGHKPECLIVVSFINMHKFTEKVIRLFRIPGPFQRFLMRPEVNLNDILARLGGTEKSQAAWLLFHQDESVENRYRLLGLISHSSSMQVTDCFLQEVMGLKPEQTQEARKVAEILFKEGRRPKDIRQAQTREFLDMLMAAQEQNGKVSDPEVVNAAIEHDSKTFIYTVHTFMRRMQMETRETTRNRIKQKGVPQ